MHKPRPVPSNFKLNKLINKKVKKKIKILLLENLILKME
jgi:hypothetical protein